MKSRVFGKFEKGWAGILLAMVFLASGCAVTRSYVVLSYDPQVNTEKIKEANTVKVKVEISDVRTIKDKVSSKKNSYGMEMARIIAQNDVADTLKKAIEAELKNRGFELADGSVLVLAELNKFYNDFKTGFWSGRAVAEVVMNVQVKKRDNGIFYSKMIAGENSHTVQIASGKNAKFTLDGALKDAISKLFNDTSFIDSLFKASTSTVGSRPQRQVQAPPQAQTPPPVAMPPQVTDIHKEKAVSASEYNDRGFEYYKNGQYNQAIENFTIALSMENNSSYYINRGSSFYELKQYDNAISDFKKAITLAPNEATAYAWCGNVYYERKSYSDASQYFSKAIAITPTSAVLYLNRGYAQFKIGNKSMAASDFKKACELGNEDGCKQLKVLENK